MKKLTILVAIFLIGVLAVSCGGTEEAKAVKTGFASSTTIADSISADGETNGEAAGYSKMVGVLVDEDGVIVDCVIDAVQSKVEFSSAGKIVTPLDTTFDSKNILGDAYGMKVASGIEKEWNEQAAFLADYVVGKTVEDIDGIALDMEGAPTDEELTAGVTIHIAPYLDVIKEAVANATDLGAKEGDTLGLGALTNIGQSADFTAEDEEGVAVLYSTYALASKDADGMITSAIIDASQAKVTFDAAGMLIVDVASTFATKNDLGDDYGMKVASSIQKEWYEQAAAFAAFATGKTIDDVKGVSMDAEGLVTDEELATMVTVHVGDFIKCLELAIM
jgi:hypothetical protein